MNPMQRRDEDYKFEQNRRQLEFNLEQERGQEIKQIYDVKYKVLAQGRHAASISELHVCLQRPILLTMSIIDQTIRIWNYATNTCELTKNFLKEATLVSCALHPSGYNIMVGLNDSIKLYHILHGELREFFCFDNIKNIKRVNFTAGG